MSDFDFDVSEFMSASYDEATSTQRLQLPDGWEGYALVTGVDLGKAGDYPKLVVKLEFSGDEISKLVNRDKMTDVADFLIDLTKDSTGRVRFDMSPGKNIDLGRFREAMGANRAGAAWNPQSAVGSSVKVRHKLDPDKNDPSKKWSRYRFIKP